MDYKRMIHEILKDATEEQLRIIYMFLKEFLA